MPSRLGTDSYTESIQHRARVQHNTAKRMRWLDTWKEGKEEGREEGGKRGHAKGKKKSRHCCC